MKPSVTFPWTKFLLSIFALVLALLTARSALTQAYRGAAHEVCGLIDRHYYQRDSAEVRRFLNSCASRLRWGDDIALDRELITEHINGRLRALKISHLALHTPEQTQQVWENEAVDTGLRARRIEDKIVVSRVLPQSVAERAGLMRGDVVLLINGEEPSLPSDVEWVGGLFQLVRQGHPFERRLVPETLAENLGPRLTDLGGGVGHLELRSFLQQYFEEDSWRALSIRLANYQGLVVDLRGNAGGSFPAMLRALSPFLCGQKEIGIVYQAAGGRKLRETVLRDDLNSSRQLEQLAEADSIRLKTFAGYGCFRGSVIVLIDSETASTAEIFAQAFYERPRSHVWGQFSSGSVVMAQWFLVHGFGEPSSALSVPIAGYVANDGREIEGQGLEPQRTLSYELRDALKGRDTWLDAARASVLK